MVASTEPTSDTVEIQVRQCAQGYMAWIKGQHQLFSSGRTPKEAIGALVSDYPFIFSVDKVYFR